MNPTLDGVRLVSWDMDGTLYPFAEAVRAVTARLAGETLRGGWRRGVDLARGLAGFHRSVEQQRREEDHRVEAGLEEFEAYRRWEQSVLKHALRGSMVPPSVLDLLRGFRRGGVRQVVWSDFDPSFKLQALNLTAFFERVYASEHIGFWKPSPEGLRRIQEDHEVSPDAHLHIGDRWDADAAACRENGCRFMSLGRSPRGWKLLRLI